MTARFAVGAATHPGMVRRQNEDSFHVDDRLFVVADGMGGHQAGEVASALAVATVRDASARGMRSAEALSAAVQHANDEIRRAALGTPDRAGMGTTLTGIAVIGSDAEAHGDDRTMLAVANVGDSRTYLWRGRRLQQITVDHSYVQELVSGGQITEQEARLHPRRNIVTRALGIDEAVRVDTWTLPAVRGDRFVVCSDGLVDEVPDHEIAALIEGIADPQQAADSLVAMANRHGGRDNVTVVVVDVLEGIDDPEETLPEPVWAEGVPEVTWAEPDTTARLAAPVGAPLPGPTPGAPTAPPPNGSTARSDRRFGWPQLAFLFGIGVIVMVVVVVVAVAVGDDAPVDGPVDAPGSTEEIDGSTPSTAIVIPSPTTAPSDSTAVTTVPPRSTTNAPTTTRPPRTTTTQP